MKKWILVIIATCALAACKSYDTLPVTLPDGFVVNSWVADTPAKQERGLMYVTQLPENQGMLFIFDEDDQQLFWMKNTLIDLDIVFMTADKTVTHVANNMPHSTRTTPDEQVAVAQGYGKYVLELAAGTAAKHGVTRGVKLNF